MNKLRGKLIWVLLVLVIFASGCSKEEKLEEHVLSILVGNHSNAPVADLANAEDILDGAVRSFGSITIINVDGKPSQYESINIPTFKKNYSDSKRDQIFNEYKGQIYDIANGCLAQTPEVDTLYAIHLGARALETKAESKKDMLILDSGLQTIGELNFTESTLESIDVEKVVDTLKTNQTLPDLTGINIYWVGLGDVMEPQQTLSLKNKNILKGVWDAVLTEAGASVEFLEKPLKEYQREESLPFVSTVELKERQNAIEEMEEVIILDEEELSFHKDSKELKTDVDEAKLRLAPIIDYLKNHQQEKILLCGTTASYGSQEDCILLSRGRCETVKNLLMEEGVLDNQIQTIGLGFENHPFHLEDIDENGKLDEEVAKKNRSVIVLPLNSEKAVEILERR